MTNQSIDRAKYRGQSAWGSPSRALRSSFPIIEERVRTFAWERKPRWNFDEAQVLPPNCKVVAVHIVRKKAKPGKVTLKKKLRLILPKSIKRKV